MYLSCKTAKRRHSGEREKYQRLNFEDVTNEQKESLNSEVILQQGRVSLLYVHPDDYLYTTVMGFLAGFKSKYRLHNS